MFVDRRLQAMHAMPTCKNILLLPRTVVMKRRIIDGGEPNAIHAYDALSHQQSMQWLL